MRFFELQAVILAGGLGTRLRPLTFRVPKPMVDINGKPFLEIKLRDMLKRGITDYVVCVGYLGNMIEEYFGDGSRFGARIRYSYDGEKLLGPIGALKNAQNLLDEDFIVTYGDNHVDVDYFEMVKKLRESKVLGLMAVLHNKNRRGKSDVDVRNGYVVAYSKRSAKGLEWINYGVFALRKEALELARSGEEEEFFNELISRRELLAFKVSKRFYDVGSHDSLEEFRRLFTEGNMHSASLNCTAGNLIVSSHLRCPRTVISVGNFHVYCLNSLSKAFFPSKMEFPFRLNCSLVGS
jgi:NDP-sugar pyrophosphorylase family protein